VKKNLIEPTFIAISTFNDEMGDWIIQKLYENYAEKSHAALLGELILCSKQETSRRILLVKQKVMNSLQDILQKEKHLHSNLIEKCSSVIEILI